MNHRQLLSSALASALSLGLVQTGQAHEAVAPKGKEKCYGIVKAGQNDCANLSGSHSCAGMAEADRLPGEWKLVAKGTCAKLGGRTEAEMASSSPGANAPARPSAPARK